MPSHGKRTAIRRTHTFTGCFTCRRRKVKCDGAKPICERCKSAGFECLGYGFRFDAPNRVQSNRQHLAASRPDLTLKLTNKQVDEARAEIYEVPDTNGVTQKDPFGVISFREETSRPEAARHLQLVERRRPEAGERPPSHLTNGYDHNGYVANGYHPRAPGKEVAVSNGSQRMTVTIQGRSNIPPYLAVVNMASQERELFGFYTRWIGNTGPLAHRQTIPMIALSGYVSNWKGMDPNAGATVFHGICAFTAISLSYMRPDSNAYRLRAYNHERLALAGSRMCIARKNAPYVAMATVIQTLLTYGHQAGVYVDTEQHLLAGVRCIELELEHKDTDPTIASLSEQFLIGLCISNFHVSPRALWSLRKGVGFETKRVSPTGVLLPLLDLILLINRTISNPLRLQEPDMKNIESMVNAATPLQDPEIDNDVHLAERIIHFSIRLYFLKTLLRQSGPALQPFVEEALQNLERLDITEATNHHAMLIWACAMLGLVAPDLPWQARVYKLCRSAEKFNVGSHDTAAMVGFVVRCFRMRPEFGGDERIMKLPWAEQCARAGTARDQPQMF